MVKSKKIILLGIGISCIYFLIHLLMINDYGLSWDFHVHHYAGLYHLGLPVPSIKDPPPVPFSAPDPRLTTADPFGPFTQIIPTLSYIWFFGKWKLLPFDVAYNLPMVFFGSAGVGLLFIFLAEGIGLLTASFAALFLALLPVPFGYLHTSMKDTASAFAFTLSIYLFWRLVKRKRLRDLLMASVAFAFAFNVKVNSVMIPVVCLIWYALKERKSLQHYVIPNLFRDPIGMLKQVQHDSWLVIPYFILAPLFAVLIWWPFWQNPLEKLMELPYFYSHNTLNMPVLLFGKLYYSGVNVPWYYPFVYIAITTPLPIFFLAVLGLVLCLRRAIKRNDIALLFLLWFFIPLLRYLSPKSGAIDGVRHFLEVIYPIAGIAGIGAAYAYNRIIIITKQKLIGFALVILIVIALLSNIVKFHPYQTSFFNQLAGGIKGAWGKFDIDFWGTPQKEAVAWLNKNAAFGSNIHVVMAQSSAGEYLRPDLVKNLNSKNIWDSDYVVLLNRQSFFSMYDVADYMRQKTAAGKIAYQRMIDDVPLVWVFKR